MSGEPCITFEGQGNYALAKLGVWEIGEVCVFWDDRVSWRLTLPGLMHGWHRASSVDCAKAHIARQARQWVDAAGLCSAAPPAGTIRASREARP